MKRRMPPVFRYLERWLCVIQAVLTLSIFVLRVDAPGGVPYRASFSCGSRWLFLVGSETEMRLMEDIRQLFSC